MDVVNQVGAAMEGYRSGNFAKAERDFARCLEPNPGDELSGTYIERCRYLTAHPPAGEWNGVWLMKEK